MKLKSLSIKGFKSFASDQQFFFDDPLCAVVGPNGSGKSNIVEAIRFVLGEQSNKSLRSRQSTDLIFGGSTGASVSEARVSIVFDNKDRIFKLDRLEGETIALDFPEVTITRSVDRNGVGSYFINDTSVRLKDIQAMLASVNIGTSGHHIISQGEADRILLASPKERREMIEDSLGLKVYKYRIYEAEKKLDKTKENIKELLIKQKETLPHLRFLEREVEKIEKARKVRSLLEVSYYSYLLTEKVCMAGEAYWLEGQKSSLEFSKDVLLKKLADAQAGLLKNNEDDLGVKVYEVEKSLSQISLDLKKNSFDLGEVSGQIKALEGLMNQLSEKKPVPVSEKVSQKTCLVSDVFNATGRWLDSLSHLMKKDNLEDARSLAKGLIEEITKYQNKLNQVEVGSGGIVDGKGGDEHSYNTREIYEGNLKALNSQKDLLVDTISQLEVLYTDKQSSLVDLKKQIEEERHKTAGVRELIQSLETELAKLETDLWKVKSRLEGLLSRKRSYEYQLAEARVLLGDMLVQGWGLDSFKGLSSSILSKEQSEDFLKSLEKNKLKLEEMGAGGGREVVAEYEDVKKKYEFLTTEIRDLEDSIFKLSSLAKDLKSKLTEKFLGGVAEISKRFGDYFTSMFGGGNAELRPGIVKSQNTDVDELSQDGLFVFVKLPGKSVSEIELLSGGEKSLTAIALLFALSQVSPPPFMVLDETDAALDEANSVRYGDMLEHLSKITQLLVVTHNRETMSRAGSIYGVTMQSGKSQVFSIKLEEAIQIAK